MVVTTAATAAVTTTAQVPDGVIVTAMLYISALAFAAGIGLLCAAFLGYKTWTWYQNRGNKKSNVKRRREA